MHKSGFKNVDQASCVSKQDLKLEVNRFLGKVLLEVQPAVLEDGCNAKNQNGVSHIANLDLEGT